MNFFSTIEVRKRLLVSKLFRTPSEKPKSEVFSDFFNLTKGYSPFTIWVDLLLVVCNFCYHLGRFTQHHMPVTFVCVEKTRRELDEKNRLDLLFNMGTSCFFSLPKLKVDFGGQRSVVKGDE